MKKDLLFAALIFTAAFLVYLPLTAIGVQESDGAEMAYQALSEGVLHPPGFPLYSLISIYLVKLFPENPYHTLAIFSALCQALAGGILFLIGKIFLKSPWVPIAISISWLFFPATFRSATDCEVFALNNLLSTLLCFFALQILHNKSRSHLFLGLATGLAWSNHHMSVFYTPLVIAACCINFSWKTILKFFLGLTLGLTPHLYLVYRIYVPYPDLFFPLANFQDLLKYLTRSYYGTFSLKHGSETNDLSYIWHLVRLICYNAPLALISSLVLIISFKKHKLLSLGILGSVIANFWFAFNLIYPDEVLVHGELLMRFYPGILLSLLISLPLLMKEYAFRNSEYLGVFLLLLIPVAWNFPNKMNAADARQDRLAEIEIRMILEELPPEAIFISNLDRQTMGIPYYQKLLNLNKKIEVVIQGAIQNPEYKSLISKRIFGEDIPKFENFSSFLRLAFERNKEVFILSGKIPEEFAILPYKHTWQIAPASKMVEIKVLTNNLLQSCASLPIEYLKISHYRYNSQTILQTAFLSGWKWLAQHPMKFPEKKIAQKIIKLYDEKQYSAVRDLCSKLLN